jgi:hypothetical protein
MGLDFTNIKDDPGAAIFILHDGTEQDEKEMKELGIDLNVKTKKQVIVTSATDTVGRNIIDFYHLSGSHFVLIVLEDDELYHVWSDGERFDPAEIMYFAEQVS